MKSIIAVLSILIVIFLFSCSDNLKERGVSDNTSNDFETIVNKEEIPNDPAPGYYDDRNRNNADQVNDPNSIIQEPQQTEKKEDELPELKIIKTGELTFQSKDIKKTRASIGKITSDLGGYVSNETETAGETRIEDVVTVRIPSKNFDLLIDQISAGVDSFDSKNISSLDVTEEFVDLQSRIKTKREVLGKYTELLQKAKTLDEVLRMENEIRTIQEEIEAKEGRLNYLQSQTSFSTLIIHFYKILKEETADKKDDSFLARLWTGITTGWKGVTTLIIGISYIWPLLLFVIAAIGIAFRMEKRWKKKLAVKNDLS